MFEVQGVPNPVVTADVHHGYGRDVLLRTGHARLVTSAADVEELTADRATQPPGLSAEFTRHTAPAAGPPERSL